MIKPNNAKVPGLRTNWTLSYKFWEMFNVRFTRETGERQLEAVGVRLGSGSGDCGEQLQTDLRHQARAGQGAR